MKYRYLRIAWSVTLGVVAVFVCGCSKEGPTDLTGAGPEAFKSSLGRMVTVRGRLENGKYGLCLVEARPAVLFFVKPDMSGSGGYYTMPESWMKHIGKQVVIKGTLHFEEGDHRPDSEMPARPAARAQDHYYMVLQDTEIKPNEQPGQLPLPESTPQQRGQAGDTQLSPQRYSGANPSS